MGTFWGSTLALLLFSLQLWEGVSFTLWKIGSLGNLVDSSPQSWLVGCYSFCLCKIGVACNLSLLVSSWCMCIALGQCLHLVILIPIGLGVAAHGCFSLSLNGIHDYNTISSSHLAFLTALGF